MENNQKLLQRYTSKSYGSLARHIISSCFISVPSFIEITLNDFRVIKRTRNCMENNQREITYKILKPELWFLCMTHRLIMLNKCTKFYCKILNGFQVIQRTQNCIENNQREITPKILKPELWFLCMTHCLVVVYKCTKFH